MTFNDILKSDFLNKVSSFSAVDTFFALLLSFAAGLLIFAVYKKTFNGVMYSSGFAVSLIAMSVITSLVILAISSNVILSLGMVGALSIVRFRTAVKDPLDIAYLFWAIAEGIVIGAGMIPLGIIGAVLIALILIIFTSRKTSDKPYILVVNCEDDKAEDAVIEAVKGGAKKHLVKSKTVSQRGIELTMEVRLQDQKTDFVNKVAAVSGVEDAVLISYNGEFLS